MTRGEGFQLAYDNSFALNYKTLLQQGSFIQVLKNESYLQWRYAAHPIHRYRNLVIADSGEVKAFCVIKNFREDLDVVDFQASDKALGMELMQGVLSLAKREGSQSVNCWAPRHHFIHTICEKLKFENHEPITYLGARCLKTTYPEFEAALRNYTNWYLQMGDSDVY